MSDMGEFAMEQDERENLSGADMQEYMEWIESIEGSYLCPYCGTIHAEFRMCCGEMHSEKICNLNKKL